MVVPFAMLSAKCVLIVAEALQSLESGHWYEHIKTITKGLRVQNVGVTIAASRAASAQILDDLRAVQ
jgi:hypothetical protein